MVISQEAFQAYNTCKPDPSFNNNYNKKHGLGSIKERTILLIMAIEKDSTKHIKLTESDVIEAGHILESKHHKCPSWSWD